jgi:hypothetical protein
MKDIRNICRTFGWKTKRRDLLEDQAVDGDDMKAYLKEIH